MIANGARDAAHSINSKYNIYSIGVYPPEFFNNVDCGIGMDLMKEIQNSGYYEVTDWKNIQSTFERLAFQNGGIINGGDSPNGTQINGEPQKFLFQYQSGDGDCGAECYYTDDYFAKSAYEFNPSLRTMSMSLAMSAFGSNEESNYENKSVNVKELLQNIGFSPESITTNDWFRTEPTTDSIGVAFGSKSIRVNGEDSTLIAVAIRGQGYGQEWASNFTMGSGGHHRGFSEARDEVIRELKNYIAEQKKKNKITGNVKFWITGFSRAAATANLVGGALDSGEFLSDGISYSPDDIYVYTFEIPQGALKSIVDSTNRQVGVNSDGDTVYLYDNIFNTVNPNDPVPYVAPSEDGYDFCRYGRDVIIPTIASDSKYKIAYDNMRAVYRTLEKHPISQGDIDDFQMFKLDIGYEFNFNLNLLDPMFIRRSELLLF